MSGLLVTVFSLPDSDTLTSVNWKRLNEEQASVFPRNGILVSQLSKSQPSPQKTASKLFSSFKGLEKLDIVQPIEPKQAVWVPPTVENQTLHISSIFAEHKNDEKNLESDVLSHYLDKNQKEEITSLDSTKKENIIYKYETNYAKVSLYQSRFCTFCKSNGETEEFYVSHVLKDVKGNVICPTLRAYTCPYCGATGSSSHTASYCPFRPESERTEHSPLKKNKNGYSRFSHGLKYTG
ncbi:hypothetical protein Btru_065206 [Bulinus truncatus]|nr:hypothetical protein Btru_065206 [Bulinus truncatus]